MLMNIINMVNCRVVNENESNVFRTLFDNSLLFWFVFLLELLVQNAFVVLAHIQSGPFRVAGALLGTGDMPWTMHLSAWIFGLFVLAIRPLTNMIRVEKFDDITDSIDLESTAKGNFVTKWSDRATDDFNRLTTQDA